MLQSYVVIALGLSLVLWMTFVCDFDALFPQNIVVKTMQTLSVN